MAAEPSDALLRSATATILKEGELSQLTSRIVRTQLEEKFNVSLLSRRKEINRMLMEIIQNLGEPAENEKEQENGAEKPNGKEIHESEKEEEEVGKEEQDQNSEHDEPSTKRSKQDESKDDISDEEFARKLQSEEKSRRARSTKKPVERKKQAKAKKSVETGRERKGYGKLMVLSPELSALLGQEMMARGDVVKQMWQIIRERKLEDPKNKRFTLCDEQLQRIIGRKRFQTFGMMKYLKKHIKDPALIV